MSSFIISVLTLGFVVPHVHSQSPGQAPAKYMQLTSLGDSYAAGVGTDYDSSSSNSWIIGTNNCLQGKDSYGNQLASDLGLAKPNAFHQQSCSAAATGDVYDCQIDGKDGFNGNKNCRSLAPHGYGSPDVVTLTVGGNDVQFDSVVEACFYGFGGDCNTNINTTLGDIQAVDTGNRVGNVIAEALKDSDRLQPANVFVTGYPALFNTDVDDGDCPVINWFTGWKPPKDLRIKLNNAVFALNSIIQEQNVAANATWVDLNPVFNTHRLCDKGEQWITVVVLDPVLVAWFAHAAVKFNAILGTLHPNEKGHTGYKDAIKAAIHH